MNTTKIYRYKFDESITSLLEIFSKLHINETKNDFNHYWELWLLENNEIIEREKNRLENIGFKGDVYQKMYKSSRYYLTKKKDTSNKYVINNKKKEYISVSNLFLETIEEHLYNYVKVNNISPSEGYKDFCNKYKILFTTEFIFMETNYGYNKDYIYSKFKKTYKNRYFNLLKK
tara:strand:+ start:1236 stop:1757 length:522 start_codon:yes stop_codon:yes gene_type:complete